MVPKRKTSPIHAEKFTKKVPSAAPLAESPRSRGAVLLRQSPGIVLFVFLLFSALWVAGDVLLRLWYEIRGPYTWDSPIYWAVGRGILNGVPLYTGLFDIKPPGIFLISALSLLFGNLTLAAVVQVCVLIAIPMSLAAATLRLTHGSGIWERRNALLLALLWGSVLLLYTAERSGEFQVESFGAGCSAVYLLLIAGRRQMSYGRMLAAAMALLAAIGLKEPFLFVCCGGAILVSLQWPHMLIRNFLYPLCIALLVGTIIMLLCDWLNAYLTLYLPDILLQHINVQGPFWMRGFSMLRILRDLWQYQHGLPWAVGSMTVLSAVLTPAKTAFWRRVLRIVLVATALYMFSTSVAVGGEYFNHHFAFAVPGYVALFLAFLETVLPLLPRFRWSLACIPILAIVICAWTQPRSDYEARLHKEQVAAAPAIAVAASVDAILDRCGMDRYLFLGSNGPQPFGYTRHSPLGPLFVQYPHLLGPSRPWFRDGFPLVLTQAQLIVFQSYAVGDLQPLVMSTLEKYFSAQPWKCAQGIALPARRYTFFFRHN